MNFSFKKLFLKTIGKLIPSDYFANRFPVSVKGILLIDNKIVLLENERGEWDLPGGKLNRNENITNCLEREIKEELSIDIKVGSLVDVVKVNIIDKIEVIVLIYVCQSDAKLTDLKLSGENFDLGLFSYNQIPTKNISSEYRKVLKNHMNSHIQNTINL